MTTVREALAELVRFVPNIEVLGEWSAMDINLSMQKKTRAQLDAMIERARAALSAPTQEPVALTFAAFRAANVTRCLKWHPAGIESWSPSDWLTAVTGELGELASLLKMRNRERDGLPGNKFSPTDKQVADEVADVLTYLDLLAAALGIDLGGAAVNKFNEVSERVGFPDRITLYAHPPAAPEPAQASTAANSGTTEEQQHDDDSASFDRRQQGVRSVSVERTGQATGGTDNGTAGSVHGSVHFRRAVRRGEGNGRFPLLIDNDTLRKQIEADPDDEPSAGSVEPAQAAPGPTDMEKLRGILRAYNAGSTPEKMFAVQLEVWARAVCDTTPEPAQAAPDIADLIPEGPHDDGSGPQPAPDDGLIVALRTQQRLDEEGDVVGVSRQACDEAAALIAQQREEIAVLRAKVQEAERMLRLAEARAESATGALERAEAAFDTMRQSREAAVRLWSDCGEDLQHLVSRLTSITAAADGMRRGEDCPMCDSGKLHDPNKEHWDTCAFAAYDAARSKK